MSGNHALIAPSSLSRTVACQAWVMLTLGMPAEARALMEKDTEETLEGNAADWVAKQYAAGTPPAYGTDTPVKGFKVDHDMIHGAKLWAASIGYGAISGIPVVIERIHPTDCWGEPDGWIWNAIERVLKIPDYKYGFGLVEEYENWQLIAYALGLMSMLIEASKGELSDTDITLELTIVQPRAYHPRGPVRTWRVNGADLRAYANIAHGAAIRATRPDSQGGTAIPEPVATVTPECLYCPARLVCKTFQNSVSQALEYVGKTERLSMSAADIGIELQILETMEERIAGRLSALRVQADALVRQGQRVTGYHMESGQSRLQWEEGVTIDQIVFLGATVDPPVDLHKPPALPNSRLSTVVTPTQAIKAGVDATVISAYASRPPGAMKLARDSTIDARRAFGETII